MLTLKFPATDESPAVTLEFEHSLWSISKWEAKYERPFFNDQAPNEEESRTYLGMMLVTTPMPEDMFARFTPKHLEAVNDYLHSKQSATIVRELNPQRPNPEIVTNEIVYNWMIDLEIPFDPCDRWHFNHLMKLIKVRSIKNTKQKPMSRQEQAAMMHAENQRRQQANGTKG